MTIHHQLFSKGIKEAGVTMVGNLLSCQVLSGCYIILTILATLLVQRGFVQHACKRDSSIDRFLHIYEIRWNGDCFVS